MQNTWEIIVKRLHLASSLHCMGKDNAEQVELLKLLFQEHTYVYYAELNMFELNLYSSLFTEEQLNGNNIMQVSISHL